MKKQKETISIDVTMDHYGLYHNDNHFKPVLDGTQENLEEI